MVAYLGAITVFGKGPTYLGYPPFFWGEAVLAAGLMWTFLRQGAAILGPPVLRRLSTAVLLFLIYGFILTANSFPDWGVDALRDAAVWYYGGFYFIGLALASRPRAADRVLENLRRFLGLRPVVGRGGESDRSRSFRGLAAGALA